MQKYLLHVPQLPQLMCASTGSTISETFCFYKRPFLNHFDLLNHVGKTIFGSGPEGIVIALNCLGQGQLGNSQVIHINQEQRNWCKPNSLNVQIPFFRCFSLLEWCEWATPWFLCYSGCHLADNCYLLYFPQSLCASPFTGVRTGVRCQLSQSFWVKGELFFIQLLPPGHAFRWPALPSHSLLEPWMSHTWGTANSHATSRRAREAESFLTFTTVRSLHKQFLRMKWMASL